MGGLYFVEAAISKEGRAEDTRRRAAATGRRRELGEDTLAAGDWQKMGAMGSRATRSQGSPTLVVRLGSFLCSTLLRLSARTR